MLHFLATPEFGLIFGVITTLMMAVSTGTVHLTNMIPATWIDPVKAWASFFAILNSAVLTAIHGANITGPITGEIMRAIRIAFASLLLVGAAHAADMPVLKAPAPAPLAAPSGLYVFADAFGAVARPNGLTSPLAPAGAGGSIGGGYDFINNGLVAGVMVSGGYESVRSTSTCVLMSCTSSNTWQGEAAVRVGLSFAAFNGMLGGNANLTALNAKLPIGLAPITALQAASVYAKAGIAIEHLKVAVNGDNASLNDIALLLGAGVELPLTTALYWRTELDWLKFNDALCGGCALPTGRPSEWKARTGVAYRF